jgi:hypothetical protein
VRDLFRWLARCLGHPRAQVRPATNLEQVDRKLNVIEASQRDIKARLTLLEKQADPRDFRHG